MSLTHEELLELGLEEPITASGNPSEQARLEELNALLREQLEELRADAG